MELTQENKAQIEEIFSGIECPKNFRCYKSGFEDLCKVRIFPDGELIECFDESGKLCKFSFDFGYGCFCKCPLRRYIAKNFNR
ncbi:MAG: hypothetical protein RQ760_21075 [Sedimentisphaerales bacterium]|nr:hypothetical protein [Sedimentisphaerales bacterium]